MLKCECYCVTEVNGEFVCDCETAKGCTLGDKTVWDEDYIKKHNIQKKETELKEDALD